MNTDDISFADFLAFNTPAAAKSVDPWQLHAYTFVPIGVEAALERVAKGHERAAAAMHWRRTKTSTLLLSGASVAQQRAAVRWLSDRLNLPAFIVDASELCELGQADLDDLLAPICEGVARLFVIRNVDALPAAVTVRLVERRSALVFVVATLNEAVMAGTGLRARFPVLDWQDRGKPSMSETLAALLGECFGRFGAR